jgi:hypothetical protein
VLPDLQINAASLALFPFAALLMWGRKRTGILTREVDADLPSSPCSS